jgi:hypothetical protein
MLAPSKPIDVIKASKRYVADMKVINEALESFAATGVAIIRDLDYGNVPDAYEEKVAFYRRNKRSIAARQQVRSFVKRIAKELKRPIITAELDGWGGIKVILTINRHKRNDVVVAPFHLLADDITSPVRMKSDGTNHYVWFHGPAGRALFEKWHREVRHDEAFRKAMCLT